MTTWTPPSRAPWQPGTEPSHIHDAQGLLVATVHDLPQRPPDETQTNYRLILAAPFLFNAALDALHYVHSAGTILARTPGDKADFAECEAHLKRVIGLVVGSDEAEER
jgi:hypothetical protein